MSAENHQWFNQQSKERQAEMNRKFQQYKKCKVVLTDDIDVGIQVKGAEISFSCELEGKKQPYSRARENREFRKRCEEELEY